jgi:hypothetical protein
MNLSNLPVFILFFASVYLSIVYGLLKIAEFQRHNTRTISPNVADSKQPIKIP